MPQTRWARTRDGTDIAYQDFGDGSDTVVVIHGWVSHLEVYWEQPLYVRFMRRLAVGMRVLVFDKRGIGMSDRLGTSVDLEMRADDVGAVMDAAGVNRAALLAWGGEAPSLAAFFAASHPERTVALCIDPWVSLRRTPDWTYGGTQEEFDQELLSEMATWPDIGLSHFEHPPDDPAYAVWCSKFVRYASTPAAYESFLRTAFDTDVTGILGSIRVRTAVFARQDSEWSSPTMANFVAELIPGARTIVIPGREPVVWVEDPNLFVGAVEDFLGLKTPTLDLERVLATLMFTDIVSSTEVLVDIGDARWRDLVALHDALAREQITAFRGTFVDSTGDGVLATFDGPARAVRCAQAISKRVEELGIQIRAGVHTGEVEKDYGRVRGVAVHIGARVMATAGPAEIRVSSTVKDLVAGSGLRFEDAGEHELKGVPERWRLYRAVFD